MADRRRVTVSTPRGPFEVEVSALLPQTDLSVEVAADSEEPQRQQRRPLDYAQLPSHEGEEGLDQPGSEDFASRAELEAIRAERDHLRRQLSSLSSPADEPALGSRALRQTAPTKNLLGGLYFTPDGRSLVHGGTNDKELSLDEFSHALKRRNLEKLFPRRAARVLTWVGSRRWRGGRPMC